uniref:Uncharacterized protein n=1 Tax=Salarias fasciatus TaxID=181472 RepID=A0A672G2D1_SALFA
MATSMDTLPAHLLPLVMEEFPQSLATACVCRAGQREPRLRCVQCGIIEEEEEDCSTLEEDQALRSFLQTVESLRRTQTVQHTTSVRSNCRLVPEISSFPTCDIISLLTLYVAPLEMLRNATYLNSRV